MTTSGTVTAFDSTFDIFEIIEEAYQMVGKEVRSGYELKTARRSLDLLTREWGNRGINMWTISESQIAVNPGESLLNLDVDTIDILDCVWRTLNGQAQQDLIMTRMSVSEWAELANKNTVSFPSKFWVQRLAAPKVQIWPVPYETGTFVYWRLRRMQDVGAYGNTMDVPSRFFPAMTSGLAYYLSMKTPGADGRIPMLQAEYERQFALAADEDRERASLHLIPARRRGRS